MKKLSFLALAAVGLLLGACSSDRDVVADENVWDGNGDGYMAISIKLPTNASTTRAANDVYDDGLADEYKVQDAALLLFTGASESAATLMSAQPLTLPFANTDNDADNDNITTSYQAVAKVSGNVNGNLYALVVLNYKNVLNVANGTATIVDGAAVNTLADIQSEADNIVPGNDVFTNKGTNSSSDYFFMTNALLQNLGSKTTDQTADEPTKATTAPAATDIQTLVKVDNEKIYPTEDEAKKNPAVDIYVERAVAKATLTASQNATTIGGNALDQDPLKIEVLEWAIDNIEPSSFIVRNPGDNKYIAYSSGAFGDDKVYRFVGDKAMGKTANLHNYYVPVYRHYWAIDPCYDKDYTTRADDAKLLPAPKWANTQTPLYCNENTFNVANQTYGNTTRAIIKCTTDGGTFYTVNGGQTRYTEDAAKTYLVTDFVDNEDFQKKIKGCLNQGQSYTFSANSVDVTFDVDENAQMKITAITLGREITGDANKFDQSKIAALTFTKEIESANENFKVLKYTDGIVYYEARFEHFANTYYEKNNDTFNATDAKNAGDLAPWNIWEPADRKPSGTEAYPVKGTDQSENDYLGRWGMVRNNWYDVQISAFKKLGSPVDPTGKIDNPTTPDDNVEEYISVKIHVLSWAKRTQQWIL